MIQNNCYIGIVKKLSVFILIFICMNLHAQPVTITLNPDEAVEIALRNNLNLESSRTSLETRKRASEMSWNQFIPSVTVAGTMIRQNEEPQGMTIDLPPMLGGPVTIGGGSQWNIAGTIQASLNISLAMFENMNRLRLDYEAGLLSYERAKAQLERDVRKAYHSMLMLQENIALLHSSVENADRQVAMAQANYNAGLVPELTFLQARVARENMRPVIDQAENGLKLYMAQFAMFLGLDYDTVFELDQITDSFDFIPVDVAQMVSQAAARKPEILELRQTILLLESARKMQVEALYPTLSLSWSHTSALMDPWNRSWFEYDNWVRSGSLTISLGLRLHSLFPFSTDNQSIKNLDDQLRTATIGLAQLIHGTEIEVYNIILSLERTRTNAQALQQTVNLAEQAYSLTEQAYMAGLQDYYQVQNAEQSLRQARVQLLEQQFNFLNGLIDLEYATGVPFGTLSGRREL